MNKKVCVGCGKAMPRQAVDKGWTVTQLAAEGKGQRWYRQCGCMPWRQYGCLIDHLFKSGRDLPRTFVNAPALPAGREEL